MIVAAGAAHGQAEPDDRCCLYSIGHVLHSKLLGHDAAFGVGAVIAMKAGGNLLGCGGIGQQIPGDLLDGELIEGHVAIERVDHPIAPAPHAALAIALIAVGVGVARGVQPPGGHSLAIAR